MREKPNKDAEIIIEFIEVGQSVKVSAVDVASGVEVSIIGPVSATREQLEQTAVAKLKYVLSNKSKKDGGPGIVV